MNYFDYEKAAEYNRERIAEEIDQVRLEESVMEQPHGADKWMVRFADWLIAEGVKLHRHFQFHAARHTHFPKSHVAP